MAGVELKYGTGVIAWDQPGAEVILPRLPARPEDPEAVVRRALQAPTGTATLDRIVRAGERVVIVTSDITRYTASEVYLPLLVDALNDLGIPDRDIEIVVALGIHRKQTEAEHKKIVGSLWGRITVSDHDCDSSADLVALGTTSGGIPVALNRRVVEADRVIVTGTVGIHYFAGFGGGRKGLVPGVAARETCMKSHFAVFNPPRIGGKDPHAAAGVLKDNPVHLALLEAARMARPDFLLNTVLSPDKELLAVFCGDLEEAHLAACAMVDDLYSVPVDAADLAVVSCGGHPKDINFIQAHKALDYGVRGVRPGGTVILLAACPDGFGNETFFDWFAHQDLTAFESELRQHYEINGQTAYATLAKARTYRVILISELSAEQTRTMGMEKAATLEDALALAGERLPAGAKTIILPDGGTVLPVIRNGH